MLEKIINDEFIRTTEKVQEGNEILESNERINDLLNKIKNIDVELFKKLDNEIGTSISLNSRHYFNKGFEAALQLTNEIRGVTVKYR